MMTFDFPCSQCGRSNTADWRQSGRPMFCAGCGESILVPAPREPVESDAEQPFSWRPVAAIRFACDGCGRKYSTKPAMAGKRIRCGGCGEKIFVPGPDGTVPPTPRPSPSPAKSKPSPLRRAAARPEPEFDFIVEDDEPEPTLPPAPPRREPDLYDLDNPYAPPRTEIGPDPWRGDFGSSSEDERIRRKYIKHEAAVKSVGILNYLGGSGSSLIGLIYMGVAIFGLPNQPPDVDRAGQILLGATFAVFGIFALLFAILLIVIGRGLRRLRTWARWMEVCLSGLGAIFLNPIAIYVLYLLLSKKGEMVFSPKYQRIIARTPQIRYTSYVLLFIVLLAILVPFCILFVIGILAALGHHR